MNPNKPVENPELVADGMVPVQTFVTRALALPPGTPARPRGDRPAFVSWPHTPPSPPPNGGASGSPTPPSEASAEDKR
jgi:hypothetical protein